MLSRFSADDARQISGAMNVGVPRNCRNGRHDVLANSLVRVLVLLPLLFVLLLPPPLFVLALALGQWPERPRSRILTLTGRAWSSTMMLSSLTGVCGGARACI